MQVPDETVHAGCRREDLRGPNPIVGHVAALDRRRPARRRCGSGGRAVRPASRISSVTGPVAASRRASSRRWRRRAGSGPPARRAAAGCRCSCSSGSAMRRLGREEDGADAGVEAVATWRSGVMSSRIQNERPWVPTTRSSSLTTRSRMDVAGMLRRSDCQCSPSSNETYTARSVPAKSRPLRTGSSRTALTMPPSGMPLVIVGPGLAAVARAVDVRTQVVEAEGVDGGVGRVGVEVRGLQQRHLGPGREGGRRLTSVQVLPPSRGDGGSSRRRCPAQIRSRRGGTARSCRSRRAVWPCRRRVLANTPTFFGTS